jgi:hypothetical protein
MKCSNILVEKMIGGTIDELGLTIIKSDFELIEFIEWLKKWNRGILSENDQEKTEEKPKPYSIIREEYANGTEKFFVCENGNDMNVIKSCNTLEQAREEIKRLEGKLLVKREVINE